MPRAMAASPLVLLASLRAAADPWDSRTYLLVRNDCGGAGRKGVDGDARCHTDAHAHTHAQPRRRVQLRAIGAGSRQNAVRSSVSPGYVIPRMLQGNLCRISGLGSTHSRRSQRARHMNGVATFKMNQF